MHNIIYHKPVQEWIDGLPLGNGDIGAMVYGGPSCFTFALNKSDVWDNRLKGEKSNLPSVGFSRVREIIEKGDRKAFDRLKKKMQKRYEPKFPNFCSCGALELKISPMNHYDKYQQRLSLDSGIVKTHCRKEDAEFKLTSFISAVDDVLAIELSNTGGETFTISLCLFRFSNHDMPSPKLKIEGGRLWLDFTFPDKRNIS